MVEAAATATEAVRPPYVAGAPPPSSRSRKNLPPYVVVCNSYKGLVRYGVKLTIAGIRGQTRVGSSFVDPESASNAAMTTLAIAKFNAVTKRLELQPEKVAIAERNPTPCRTYKARSTNYAESTTLDVLQKIFSKRKLRESKRSPMVRGKKGASSASSSAATARAKKQQAAARRKNVAAARLAAAAASDDLAADLARPPKKRHAARVHSGSDDLHYMAGQREQQRQQHHHHRQQHQHHQHQHHLRHQQQQMMLQRQGSGSSSGSHGSHGSASLSRQSSVNGSSALAGLPGRSQLLSATGRLMLPQGLPSFDFSRHGRRFAFLNSPHDRMRPGGHGGQAANADAAAAAARVPLSTQNSRAGGMSYAGQYAAAAQRGMVGAQRSPMEGPDGSHFVLPLFSPLHTPGCVEAGGGGGGGGVAVALSTVAAASGAGDTADANVQIARERTATEALGALGKHVQGQPPPPPTEPLTEQLKPKLSARAPPPPGPPTPSKLLQRRRSASGAVEAPPLEVLLPASMSLPSGHLGKPPRETMLHFLQGDPNAWGLSAATTARGSSSTDDAQGDGGSGNGGAPHAVVAAASASAAVGRPNFRASEHRQHPQFQQCGPNGDPTGESQRGKRAVSLNHITPAELAAGMLTVVRAQGADFCGTTRFYARPILNYSPSRASDVSLMVERWNTHRIMLPTWRGDHSALCLFDTYALSPGTYMITASNFIPAASMFNAP